MERVKASVRSFGLPRLIITLFFLLLLVLAGVYKLDLPALISAVIGRFGMNAILVLAMVPGVRSGIGLNFGVSLGIVSGILGSLVSVELDLAKRVPALAASPHWAAFLTLLIALACAMVIATVFGTLYGLLLNRVKGSEMAVSTYVGFSIIALMNIVWVALPFKNGEITLPVGGMGMRQTVNLENYFSGVLSNFLSFNIGRVFIPTGLLLFVGLCCLLVWLFLRSRTGMAMSSVGDNPSYARATGISVDRMRLLGTAFSTILGAVGIIAYAQSYGFLQLYNAPLMMPFACVASILIGGASIQKASIVHVFIGTFLFQGILTVALPVINEMLPGSNLSEVIRIILSNGIILYALTKAGGGQARE